MYLLAEKNRPRVRKILSALLLLRAYNVPALTFSFFLLPFTFKDSFLAVRPALLFLVTRHASRVTEFSGVDAGTETHYNIG